MDKYKSLILKTEYKLSPEKRKYFRDRKRIQKENGSIRVYKTKPASKEYHRNYWRQMRKLILENYGGKCKCCSEDRFEFLSIDHINGGGVKHRQEVKNISQWLVKNNFPPEFRILCHNCNMSMGVYKYCPHENLKILTK